MIRLGHTRNRIWPPTTKGGRGHITSAAAAGSRSGILSCRRSHRSLRQPSSLPSSHKLGRYISSYCHRHHGHDHYRSETLLAVVQQRRNLSDNYPRETYGELWDDDDDDDDDDMYLDGDDGDDDDVNDLEEEDSIDGGVDSNVDTTFTDDDDDDVMQDHFSTHNNNLEGKTVAELKALLKERRLRVTGRKADLIERLQQNYLSEGSSSGVVVSKDDDDDDESNEPSSEAEVEEDDEEEDPEFCFDTSNDYKLVRRSILEKEGRLLNAMNVPSDEHAQTTAHEAESLVQLLPAELTNMLTLEDRLPHLMEVVMDVGRRPFAWINDERYFLGEDLVTHEQLQQIADPLHFGPDNRAGINGSLHRISAIRNREGQCVGLTLRVGRYIPGNSIMIADILAGMPNASILVLGEPGSGKTSLIRDAARFLAERHSLLIVDTSCEIGGSGDIPHECIGLSRRMQVKNVDAQASVMVECVQNHTPAVMVIDEIGREAEVRAALTCKERGVRIVASAHGSMPSLVRNKVLCDLVGGVDVVTVGDRTARDDARRRQSSVASKLKAQRRGPPIFDVIIELKRGRLHDWQVVLNSASAVDSILTEGHYKAQVRTREGSGASTIRLRSVTRDANDLDKIIEEASHNESMLTSIPVREDQPDDNNVFVATNRPAHLDPWNTKCRTCPICRRTLKSRKGFLTHIASKASCRLQFPDELVELLHKEGKKSRIHIPYFGYD